MSRIVPWADDAEWAHVYTWLYSDCSSKRQLGVDRVCAWRSRGRVPVAVDATATLVEVNLFSERLKGINGLNQGAGYQMPLRLMYAMAVTRFVNGMVDNAQKGAYARSVAALATQLALTEWLVDLRHEATHTQLPALNALRLAADEALSWLRRHYWDKQASHVQLATQAAKQKLDGYLVLQATPLPEGTIGKARGKELSAAMKDFIQSVGSDTAARNVLVPLLLSDGYLVPKERKARPNTLESLASTSPKLLEEFESLLTSCHNTWPSFSTALFHALIDALIQESADVRPSHSRLRTLAAWAMHVAGQHNVAGDETGLLKILKTCSLSPNQYTHAILNAMTADMDMGPVGLLRELGGWHYSNSQGRVCGDDPDQNVPDDVIEAFLMQGKRNVVGQGERRPMRNGWEHEYGSKPVHSLSLGLPDWLDTDEAETKGLMVRASDQEPHKRTIDVISDDDVGGNLAAKLHRTYSMEAVRQQVLHRVVVL